MTSIVRRSQGARTPASSDYISIRAVAFGAMSASRYLRDRHPGCEQGWTGTLRDSS
jgi:hypothetical protein